MTWDNINNGVAHEVCEPYLYAKFHSRILAGFCWCQKQQDEDDDDETTHILRTTVLTDKYDIQTHLQFEYSMAAVGSVGECGS